VDGGRQAFEIRSALDRQQYAYQGKRLLGNINQWKHGIAAVASIAPAAPM
jgi:hypothetical protein